MMRMMTTLLLAAVLAACGGSRDETDGMMDGGSDTAADSAQMGGTMESESAPSMSRDTARMRRP